MLIPVEGLTPSVVKMVQILADGRYHKFSEIQDKYDKYLTVSGIHNAIAMTKGQLRMRGFSIVNEQFEGQSQYRLVRYLDTDD